jgi:hypothetical protein
MPHWYLRATCCCGVTYVALRTFHLLPQSGHYVVGRVSLLDSLLQTFLAVDDFRACLRPAPSRRFPAPTRNVDPRAPRLVLLQRLRRLSPFNACPIVEVVAHITGRGLTSLPVGQWGFSHNHSVALCYSPDFVRGGVYARYNGDRAFGCGNVHYLRFAELYAAADAELLPLVEQARKRAAELVSRG